jgi:hypothetical protein
MINLSQFRARIRGLLRRTPLHYLYYAYVVRARPKGQTDEGEILRDLVGRFAVPKLFVEFGFHPREFNCGELSTTFEGLLIDGDRETVALAQRLLPRTITSMCRFLDRENLGVISDFCAGRELGVLSIDVDGNDYWFLERLLPLRPAVVVVEYNASLGLRPLSVTYDKAFDRHAKHPSGWYHGASLAALAMLCESAGYGLVAVTRGGGNAFFVRRDVLGDAPVVAPDAAYRENTLRNAWSRTKAAEQWERIKHLSYVDVSPQSSSTRQL